MARAKEPSVGPFEAAFQRLIQAQATLTANQAAFLAQASEMERERTAMERRWEETQRLNAERFARIEALLLEHSLILRALPDAVREKIGFKAP